MSAAKKIFRALLEQTPARIRYFQTHPRSLSLSASSLQLGRARSPDSVKSIFDMRLVLVPFHKLFHYFYVVGVTLLKPLAVVKDESSVLGRYEFPINVGYAAYGVGNMLKEARLEIPVHRKNHVTYDFMHAKHFLDQRRFTNTRLRYRKSGRRYRSA